MSRKVSLSRHGDFPVIRVSGDITSKESPEISRQIDRVCKVHCEKVVIDLEKTDFVDSHGLGILIYYWKNLRDQKRELILLKPRGFLEQMLEGTNLTRVFTIVPDLDMI